MAKKYESDVDADEFIRSFREEPSSTGGLKRIQVPEEPTAAPTETAQPQNTPRPGRPKGSSKSDEEDFSERFVRNSTHMRPKNKYLMVEISPEYIKKIKRILSYEDGGCSVKAYVNNVLAEHFKEFDEIIKKRL